jgi:hypothetical protein
MYTLEVSYPLALYFNDNLDNAIEDAVQARSDGSGAGFGQRDVTFTFNTAEAANAAAVRAESVNKLITCSVYAND